MVTAELQHPSKRAADEFTPIKNLEKLRYGATRFHPPMVPNASTHVQIKYDYCDDQLMTVTVKKVTSPNDLVVWEFDVSPLGWEKKKVLIKGRVIEDTLDQSEYWKYELPSRECPIGNVSSTIHDWVVELRHSHDIGELEERDLEEILQA